MPCASLTTRDAVSGRNPRVPFGLGRRKAACSVGAPGRSWGYALGAPPCIRSRGARNAAHCTFSTAF